MKQAIKKLIPSRIIEAGHPVYHLLGAAFWNIVYGFPARGLKVVGVTGTNGKTTTSFFIHSMLSDAGVKTGLMTTVGYGVQNIAPQADRMTTAGSRQLLRRIKQMRKQGMEWLVLETTSHALAQHRVFGIPYSIAVLTNINHEHLDYHKTFERYKNAKLRLFKLAERNKKGLRLGVVNAEDPVASEFALNVLHSVTYGTKQGDVQAKNLKLTPSGASYSVEYHGRKYSMQTFVPGKFNVYNSLAALIVGEAAGLAPKQIEQGIASLKTVDGRMNHLDAGQDFDVIIDFAHTPGSFEKLFKDLRPVVKGKMIAVFGSPGQRDEAKRPVQGELAGKYCDTVILTEDDPRDADPMQIMQQIAEGAIKAGKTEGKDLFLVEDRVRAIELAMSKAKKGDTVLLLSKGHEKFILRNHGEDPWDEAEVATKAIKKTQKA